MAYRGMGRDCKFVWAISGQDTSQNGNWKVQAAGDPGKFALAKQIPWEIDSFTPRPDYGKRQTTGIGPVNWPTIQKRVAPLETWGFDVSGPVTPCSIIYPLGNICNWQGWGAIGTVHAADEIFSWTLQPQNVRGTTVSSYTWPACISGRVLYDVGTSDAYDPALVETFELRFDENAELQMSVGCFVGSCYEGTVIAGDGENGTDVQVDPDCPYTADRGTVRYNGTVTAIRSANISLSRPVIPHQGMDIGTLISAVGYGPISGRGDITFYLETQSDWDAIEQDCRNKDVCATLTFHYTSGSTYGDNAGSNAPLFGTVYIDPLTVTKPIGGDGELMRTLSWEMVGPDHDSAPTAPFTMEGTFQFPFTMDPANAFSW